MLYQLSYTPSANENSAPEGNPSARWAHRQSRLV